MAEKTIEQLQAEIEALRELRKEELATGSTWDSDEVKQYTNSLERLSEELKGVTETEADAKKANESFDAQLQKSIKTLTGVTNTSDTLIGSFMNLTKQEKGLEKGFQQLGKTVKKTLNPFNVLSSTLAKIAEGSIALAMANDKAMASFNGATGAGGRYNDQILALEKSNRRFGIGAAEASNALQGLIGGLSGFGLMADDTQTALADEVAELSKLGVAVSDTTGVLQSATKTFGMTTDAAVELNQEAEALAQELGISLGQAVGDLNRALPQLAVLSGDQVSGAFKRLSEQAQETGLSIDNLTSIADKFMTFESASKAAGNLNAVLGTQMFDTMGLLEAQLEGPDVFIDKLRADLQASIGDFDTLTVFQKQSIANAAGMSVIEVRNLMNAEALTDEQQEQAKSRQENLKAAMSLLDELKAVAVQLTVSLAPVISGIGTVLDYTGRFLGFLGKAPGAFGLIAQVIALTVLPMIIKMGAQFLLQVTGLGRVHAAIMRNVRAMDQYLARQRQAAMPLHGPALPPGSPGGAPPPVPGAGGRFSGFSAKGAGLGLGATLLGGGLKKAGYEKTGGALQGAGTGAMMGAMFGVHGAAIGGVLGGIGGALGFFNKGTDSTPNRPGEPIIVGDDPGNPRAKPEMVVPPPGSAVINNSTLKAAVRQNTGGQSNGEVLAAIKALASRKIEVTSNVQPVMLEKTFNGQFNKKVGAPGTT